MACRYDGRLPHRREHAKHVRNTFENEWQRNKIGFFNHRADRAEVEVTDFNRADSNLFQRVRLRAKYTTVEHVYIFISPLVFLATSSEKRSIAAVFG